MVAITSSCSWTWVDVGGVGLGEDRADRGRDHLGRALGDLAEHVAQEVKP
jgi:hypothetical protein